VVGEYWDEDSCSSSAAAAVLLLLLLLCVLCVVVAVVAVVVVVVLCCCCAVVCAASPLGVDLWVEVGPQYPPALEPVMGSPLAQEPPEFWLPLLKPIPLVNLIHGRPWNVLR
jgi:hypothetical protein